MVRGVEDESRGAVHRGPFWSTAAVMAGVSGVVQLLLALVLGGPGRDLVWVVVSAGVFGVAWTLLMRPWLRVAEDGLTMGHGPFTRVRLSHADVDVVRDVTQASGGRRPALHDIGWSLSGRRLVVVRETGFPVAVTVADVAEAMDDLRAAGVPVSSTG